MPTSETGIVNSITNGKRSDLNCEAMIMNTTMTASLFAEWFLGLDTRARQLVDDAVARMRLGNLGNCNRVGDGVVERRIDSGPGYRIYFGKDGDVLIILLAGGTKQRQQRDVEAAQSRWADYRRRKRK